MYRNPRGEIEIGRWSKRPIETVPKPRGLDDEPNDTTDGRCLVHREL